MDLTKFNYDKNKEYIYLVKVEYRYETLLKIGFTKGLEDRMDCYEMHNPCIELIDIREGGRDLESYLHLYFSEFSYPNRKEWFYYNDKIINEFKTIEIIEEETLKLEYFKRKIYEIFKPKSTKELKQKYCEMFGNEKITKKLDIYLLETFRNINRDIERYIESLDYSNLPQKLDPTINYIISFPPMFSIDNVTINLDQILKRSKYNRDSKNNLVIYIGITHEKYKMLNIDFEKYIEKKMRATKNLSEVLNRSEDYEKWLSLAENLCFEEKHYQYATSYLIAIDSIDKVTGERILQTTINDLVVTADRQILKLFQKDYINRMSLIYLDYNELGGNKNSNKSNKEMNNSTIEEIYNTFTIGKRYSNKEIKSILKDLYERLGYRKTAKATDLNLLFMTKPILTPDKKPGLEILGRK